MIKILYTLQEGGIWTPLFLHNITKKDFESILPEGDKNTLIREGHLTIIIDAQISSVVFPNKIRTWSVIFHSIMFEDGNIFDSTMAAMGYKKSWRNNQYTAKDFKAIWKEEGKKQHKKWLKKLEEKRKDNK